MKPLVSVIIPTYNRAQSLVKAIKSVQRQTFSKIEILICDDGSTDNSRQLVTTLSHSDPRIIWLEGKHSGLPAVPRNRGIRHAKGEWIAFLDSDDIWLSNKISSQLVQKNQYDMICSNAIRLTSKSKPSPYFSQTFQPHLKFFDLINDNYVICSSVIARRDCLVAVGLFPVSVDLKVGEDYALWLKTASKYKIGYLSTPLLKYSDDPQHSIRCESKYPEEIRAVLKDYLHWSFARHPYYWIIAYIKYLLLILRK